MPVTLINFSHIVEGSLVTLEWNTASELNNDFFTLERSADGMNFREIARVAGAGTTSEMVNYQYLDRLPGQDASYYRLSQTDFDGTHEILGVVSVQLQAISQPLKIYPNPVINTRVIYLEGAEINASWSIYSLAGERMRSGQLSGKGEVDVEGLRSGTYVLKLNGKKSGVLVIK